MNTPNPSPRDLRREFHRAVLNSFPFVFLPLVCVIALLCALLMPLLTGVGPAR